MYGDYVKTLDKFDVYKKCMDIYNTEFKLLEATFNVRVKSCSVKNITMAKKKAGGSVKYQPCSAYREGNVTGVGIVLSFESNCELSSDVYKRMKEVAMHFRSEQLFGQKFQVISTDYSISCDKLRLELWLFSERISERVSTLMCHVERIPSWLRND